MQHPVNPPRLPHDIVHFPFSTCRAAAYNGVPASSSGGLQYTENGIKDCSACLFPHRPENYDRICARFAELAALCRRPPEEEAGTPL